MERSTFMVDRRGRAVDGHGEGRAMIDFRGYSKTFLIFAALATPPTAMIAAAAQTTSSATLLLEPHVHIGQSFTWKGQLRGRSVIPSNRGPVEHFDSRADILTCTILRGGSNAFFVSRQAKLDAGPHKT